MSDDALPGGPDAASDADDPRLDGNAAAGLLGEVFAFEVTTSLGACAGCGALNPVGAVVAYLHGMGAVLRCPACGQALIRVARLGGRLRVDLRGLRYLQLDPRAPSLSPE